MARTCSAATHTPHADHRFLPAHTAERASRERERESLALFVSPCPPRAAQPLDVSYIRSREGPD